VTPVNMSCMEEQGGFKGDIGKGCDNYKKNWTILLGLNWNAYCSQSFGKRQCEILRLH
jgi:hypothetical protein